MSLRELQPGAAQLCIRGTSDWFYQNSVLATREGGLQRLANDETAQVERKQTMTAGEIWNAEVKRLANDRGCGFAEAWNLTTILAPELYRAFEQEAAANKRQQLANAQEAAAAARQDAIGAADRATAGGKWDDFVTAPVASALGLKEGAPLTAVRQKLAGGQMLNGGLKSAWTQHCVGIIQKRLGIDYTRAFSSFLELVPELYGRR